MSRTPMPFKNANVQFTRRVIFGASFALASSSWVRFSADARQSTPVASPSGDDDAVQLLEDAAQAMSALDTFAFDVVTAQGETVILEGLTLQGIQGVVRRPTDFETSVTVEIPFASIDLTAVSVDGEVWINVPSLGGSDSGWQSFGNSDGLLSLLNPDVLILEAVRYLDDATIDGEGDLDGIDVKYVTGTVNFQAIAQSFVGDTETLPTEIAEGPADVTVAVDVDNLVREIEIVGPLLASEASDVIRLVTFSAFNEPVDIQQPEI
jgi:hypothetical protein